MKTVDRIATQGDMLIIRIGEIPTDATQVLAEGAHIVLAHSETGHHHVIEHEKAEVFQPADDEFIAYIHAIKPAEITHQREFDTHESLLLPPGNYQVRRQREYTPEGFRRAQD